MAALDYDNVILGRFIRDLALDRARCILLAGNEALATLVFGALLTLPAGH
jgi:hypothetical protein